VKKYFFNSANHRSACGAAGSSIALRVTSSSNAHREIGQPLGHRRRPDRKWLILKHRRALGGGRLIIR
jgi:hypothetical protein